MQQEMNKLIRSIEYVYYRLRLTFAIRRLDIESAGKDEDGFHFIRLRNSYFFFGPASRTADRKYYRLLPAGIRKQLPFPCFNIAIDIITRHVQGGLKLGGPRKQSHYQVREGDIAAEMGAFRGYYCMKLAGQVGSKGRVIAIEPQEQNLTYLRRNVVKNNLTQVTIVPVGVWKERDKLTFQRSKDDYQSSSLNLQYDDAESCEVPVDSLDNILADNGVSEVDLMIIQLNGVEYEALQGLTKVQPGNFAIAARYGNDQVKTPQKIRELLQLREYRVKIESGDYIFATRAHE